MSNSVTKNDRMTPAPSSNANPEVRNGKPSGAPRPQNAASIAYEKRMKDIDAKIEAARLRLEDLRMGGTGKSRPGVDTDARAALVEEQRQLRAAIRPQMEEKRRLIEQVNRLKEEIEKKAGQAKEAKDKLPFRTTKEMEARIHELEAQIETGQFKLIEEKQILAEVSKLRRARKALDNIDGSASDVGSLRLRIDKIRSEIALKDEAMSSTRVKLDTLQGQINELNGLRSEQMAQQRDSRALIDQAKKDLDDAFAQRRTAYEENKTIREQARKAFERRQFAEAEQRRVYKLEEKLESLEEQLLSFNSETATDRKLVECNTIRAFFETVAPSKKGIKLPLHILAACADLGLPIPSKAAEVPEVIKAIDARKESLLGKQDDGVAEMQQKRQAIIDQIDAIKAEIETKPAKTETAKPEEVITN